MINVINPFLISALPSFSFGNALRFDGVNDRVDFSSEISIPVSGEFSLSAWFKSDSFAVKILFGSSTIDSSFVSLDSTSEIRVNNGGTFKFTVPTMFTNTWYHLFITRINATDGKLYLNGVESSSGTLNITNASFKVGKLATRANNSNPFDGVLDEFSVWDGVVGTAQNALDLYNSGNGALASDVIASPNIYLRLNESSGTTASDSSANSNDGTLINFADPVAIPGWEAH